MRSKRINKNTARSTINRAYECSRVERVNDLSDLARFSIQFSWKRIKHQRKKFLFFFFFFFSYSHFQSTPHTTFLAPTTMCHCFWNAFYPSPVAHPPQEMTVSSLLKKNRLVLYQIFIFAHLYAHLITPMLSNSFRIYFKFYINSTSWEPLHANLNRTYPARLVSTVENTRHALTRSTILSINWRDRGSEGVYI